MKLCEKSRGLYPLTLTCIPVWFPAARSMKEWATGEENVCIQAVYVKLAELSLLQQELYVNYATQVGGGGVLSLPGV